MKIRQQQGFIAWGVSLFVLVIAGCSAGSSDTPYAPTGSQYQFMTDYLEPASDVIWGSAGAVITV